MGSEKQTDPCFAITTDGLRKTYSRPFGRRKVTALDGLSIQIQKGEIYGLLGPNGAGKTTLLKLLLGIVSPTAGSAELFGKSVKLASSRLRVGFLPEDHRFPPFLTAMQTLIVYGRLATVDKKTIQEKAPKLLEQVGLNQWSDARLKEFSKGMMQRLGIAQALMNDPSLLFLDEPTDGVDPIGRRQIRDLLVSLKGTGMTIFLNSHLLSEVEHVCTRVGILHRGKLVRTGSVEDLTRVSGKYEIQIADDQKPLVTESFPDMQFSDRLDEAWVRLEAADATELNQQIDRLRNSGVQILSIVPQVRSLEASFMEIIGDIDGDEGGIPRFDKQAEVGESTDTESGS
ncbi:MAG: ABC transporter ATP-binding protein [Rhodothermia bacterium]|nr:MAG: ABC transporter ATP-binding protein [Rhodothermia bacterium]